MFITHYKRAFSFSLALCIGMLLCVENTSAQIVVEADSVDCGQTLYADSVSATFILHNNYKMPTLITKVDASCGCTTVDYPVTPIKSKGKCEIVISYDAMQLGHYAKWVDVYLRDVDEPIRLTMYGEIKSPRQPFKGRKRFAKNYDKI